MEQILRLTKVYAFSFDFLNKKALWYIFCGLFYAINQLTGLWLATLYMPQDNTGLLAFQAIATVTAPSITCFLFFRNKIQKDFIEFESVTTSIIFIMILVMLYPLINFGFWEHYHGVELNFLYYLSFIGGLNIFFTIRTLFTNYEK